MKSEVKTPKLEMNEARKKRRAQIVTYASSLLDANVSIDFDAVHSPICPIDVVILAGAPWLKPALERDFLRDESSYKKIGGGANSPKVSYFFRSAANLIHFFKRQKLYVPKGGKTEPQAGMAIFFDWDDRGRFNFTPDRSGIISVVHNKKIAKVIMAVDRSSEGNYAFVVEEKEVLGDKLFEKAIIGYADLP